VRHIDRYAEFKRELGNARVLSLILGRRNNEGPTAQRLGIRLRDNLLRAAFGNERGDTRNNPVGRKHHPVRALQEKPRLDQGQIATANNKRRGPAKFNKYWKSSHTECHPELTRGD